MSEAWHTEPYRIQGGWDLTWVTALRAISFTPSWILTWFCRAVGSLHNKSMHYAGRRLAWMQLIPFSLRWLFKLMFCDEMPRRPPCIVTVAPVHACRGL